MASNGDKEKQSFTFRAESGVLEAIAVIIAKRTDPRVRTMSDAARLGMQLVLEKMAEDDTSEDREFYMKAARMYRRKMELELRRDIAAAAQETAWLSNQFGSFNADILD